MIKLGILLFVGGIFMIKVSRFVNEVISLMILYEKL